MDPKLFATVFASVFIAELGDKTQLATLLSTPSDAERSRLTVFAASASALVLTSALGVWPARWSASTLSPKLVRWIAGLGFIAGGRLVLAAARASCVACADGG